MNKQELSAWRLIRSHLSVGNTEPAKAWIRESPTNAAKIRRQKYISSYVNSNMGVKYD